jgi:glutamyl-tRNA synthetase
VTVRTRVAPSPTGDPHVGTGYIALFNYCFAKKHGGEFLLRIEDTDQVRSTPQSETRILESLKWLGIEWDEGPDCGGPHGPYRQSQRSAIYQDHCQQLLDGGHAFHCFCTRERLADMRAKQREAADGYSGYDGHCIGIDPAEAAKRAADGEEHVIRMKVPREGVCVIDDQFRGDIEIEWTSVDMQILMKSDGLPTYHLANVVDDHLMEITHVMRGEEWISSAPKHLLLYQYFGWNAPKLAHLPLLRNPDKSKLSKRKNPTSINYYERMGFMPEALLNYLGMMAFSMPDEQEKFTLREMVDAFDFSRVSLGAPVFDVTKLEWLNGKYIREDLDVEGFAEKVAEWALNPEYLKQIVPMIQERVDKFSDLADMTAHFFTGIPVVDPEMLENAGALKGDDLTEMLQLALWQLEALSDWQTDKISATLRDVADKLEVKFRDLIKPFFVAMSGKPASTPMFDTMALIGPDLTRARVRNALNVAGGVSKKRTSKLQKKHQALFH